MPIVNSAVLRAANPTLQAVLGCIHYLLLPSLNSAHIDRDTRRAKFNSVRARAACVVRDTRARNERFGRSATGVHACAAKQMALDDRDGLARTGQSSGQGWAGLAGADNNRVVFVVVQSAVLSVKDLAIILFERR